MGLSADELRATGFVETRPGTFSKVGKGALLQTGDRRPTAKLEPDPGHGAVGQVPIQKKVGGRFLVRVKSYRKRLLDADNLAEKYLVDLCRYSGALPGDAPGTAEIEVCQEKVSSKERERVVIEIYKAAVLKP